MNPLQDLKDIRTPAVIENCLVPKGFDELLEDSIAKITASNSVYVAGLFKLNSPSVAFQGAVIVGWGSRKVKNILPIYISAKNLYVHY